ncbi:hypothetical protein CYMTET_24105, partial [Cymbomonas tetramitiformis]
AEAEAGEPDGANAADEAQAGETDDTNAADEAEAGEPDDANAADEAGAGEPDDANAADEAGAGEPDDASAADEAGAGEPDDASAADEAGTGEPDGSTAGGEVVMLEAAAKKDWSEILRGSTKFVLRDNKLGPEGAGKLAEALMSENCKLQHLDLQVMSVAKEACRGSQGGRAGAQREMHGAETDA